MTPNSFCSECSGTRWVLYFSETMDGNLEEAFRLCSCNYEPETRTERACEELEGVEAAGEGLSNPLEGSAHNSGIDRYTARPSRTTSDGLCTPTYVKYPQRVVRPLGRLTIPHLTPAGTHVGTLEARGTETFWWGDECPIDLPRDVQLEAPEDLGLGLALGRAPLTVYPRARSSHLIRSTAG